MANRSLLVSKNGNEIPIADSGAPILNEKKEIVGVVLVFRDQTEEREANRAIADSELKFRNLFENSPIGKSMTGIDGSMHVNQAFSEMLGYTPEELMSVKWMEISPPEDVEKSNQVVQDLLNGEAEKFRFENNSVLND